MTHFEYRRVFHNESFLAHIGVGTPFVLMAIFCIFTVSQSGADVSYTVLIGTMLSICVGISIFCVLFFKRQQKHSNQNSEWCIRLTDDCLSWFAPQHSLGEENSFIAQIDDIAKIVRHCIMGYEAMHQVDYFLHLKSGECIQLRGFSGISLDTLCQTAEKLGVKYEEIFV